MVDATTSPISVATTVGGHPSALISSAVERAAIDAAIKDTADQVKQLLPSTPSPGFQILATMVVRWALGLGGMYFATLANTVTGSEVEQVSGIVAILLAVGWSYVQKRYQSWHEHQTALASAAASAQATTLANAPVAVPVQPPSGAAA